MDWLVYLEYLQSFLKKFNIVITFPDNFLIQYFWNSLRLSISTQLNKRNYDLDDWQKIIEWALNAKAKTSYQVSSLIQESDVYCSRGYRSIQSAKFKDKNKNIKAKKIYSSLFANQDNSRNES